jgi:hypothetical protein
MKMKEAERKKKSLGGKKGNEVRWKNQNQNLLPSPSQERKLSREEERLKSVFGEEVEQEAIRNKPQKWEV